MNRKFFTLAAGLMLCSAFGTVSAELIEKKQGDTAPNVIKVDKEGGAEVVDYLPTVKFASGSNYYVVMVGNDGFASTDVALGISKTETGQLKNESRAVSGITVTSSADSEKYLWKVSKVTGTDGKTYYTLYNAKAGAYLAFNTSGGWVKKASDAVLGKEGQSAYFSIGTTGYDGSAQTLVLAAKTENSVSISTGDDGITSAPTADDLKIVLYKAAEVKQTANNLNTVYAGGNGQAAGASFKFATEPDENIFAQKLLAVDLDGVDENNTPNWEANYPKGTYFAVYYPTGGINDEADFLASTFVSMDLDNAYDLNGLDNKKGQGYGFKVVPGTDLKASPDIEKGELPAVNAAFTVTVTDPSNAPTKFDIALNNTKVIKDGKYVAGEAVKVYVASNAGAKILTTGATATKAELGLSNIIKPEALLKKDAPAVYKIKFISGTHPTYSEYGKYLHYSADYPVSPASSTWTLLAEGADLVGANSPAIQWTIAKVNDNGTFVFRNRENGEPLTLGLHNVDGYTTITYSSIDEMQYGCYSTSNEYLSGDVDLVGTAIELIPVETIDPMAGFLNLSDEEIAYGPVKINFANNDNRIADDLYLSETQTFDGHYWNYSVEAKKESFNPIMWNVIKHDLSAAEKRAAKSDTIQVVRGYAYWDATKKAVKASATGDTIAVLAYSFKENEGVRYLDENATGFTYDSDQAGKFVFKVEADGSYSMLQADTYANMIDKDTKVASIDATGAVDFNAEPLYADYGGYRDVYLVRDDMESLESVSRHAALQAVNGGFVGVGAANDAIVAAKSEAGTDLTFWLDTADVDTYYPSFFISKGIAAETKAAETDRLFLFNPKDSATYYNAGIASEIKNRAYYLDDDMVIVKAMFRPATLVNQDTLTTTINGKEATIAAVANAKEGVLGGLNNYKFNIVKVDEDEYFIRSVSNGAYLYNLNGKLGFTYNTKQALAITLAEGDATANEAIAAESGVQVIGGQGVVTVQGAAGKVITVANILGQTIANQVATSDNVTIAVPAGIAVVAVDGEATKVVVK